MNSSINESAASQKYYPYSFEALTFGDQLVDNLSSGISTTKMELLPSPIQPSQGDIMADDKENVSLAYALFQDPSEASGFFGGELEFADSSNSANSSPISAASMFSSNNFDFGYSSSEEHETMATDPSPVKFPIPTDDYIINDPTLYYSERTQTSQHFIIEPALLQKQLLPPFPLTQEQQLQSQDSELVSDPFIDDTAEVMSHNKHVKPSSLVHRKSLSVDTLLCSKPIDFKFKTIVTQESMHKKKELLEKRERRRATSATTTTFFNNSGVPAKKMPLLPFKTKFRSKSVTNLSFIAANVGQIAASMPASPTNPFYRPPAILRKLSGLENKS